MLHSWPRLLRSKKHGEFGVRSQVVIDFTLAIPLFALTARDGARTDVPFKPGAFATIYQLPDIYAVENMTLDFVET